MSEIYKHYLALVEKIRDVVNNTFSDKMEKKPNTEGLLPEKAKEVLKKHSAEIRDEVLKVISNVQPEIKKFIDSNQRDRRSTLYPGLYSSEDSKKQIGVVEQNNALLLFRANWDQGNYDSLINSIQSAVEAKQYVFASTLFDQIRDSKSTNELHDTIKRTAEELEKLYHKTIGVDVYDEKLKIMDYADRLSQASKILIERSEFSGDERYYLPEYGSTEFQDQMILADIETQTGVNFDSPAGEPVASSEATE